LEWEAYDTHSGLLEVSWRLFDNFTQTDIVHGKSYERPQGQTQVITVDIYQRIIYSLSIWYIRTSFNTNYYRP